MKQYIGQLKDDSTFLLNEVESNFNDKPIEKYKEKQRYEQAVSECKKWYSLIKIVLGRKLFYFKK